VELRGLLDEAGLCRRRDPQTIARPPPLSSPCGPTISSLGWKLIKPIIAIISLMADGIKKRILIIACLQLGPLCAGGRLD